MTLSSDARRPVVGFDAGWRLVFRADDGKGFPLDKNPEPVILTRADYDADLRVDADDTFKGATFEITVDGLLDEDLARLSAGNYVHVQVLLGWRDLGKAFRQALQNVGATFGVGGRAGASDGLKPVLDGRIYVVERSRGEVRYRTKFTGIDAQFHRMRATDAALSADDVKKAGSSLLSYFRLLCDLNGVKVTVHAEGEAGSVSGVLDVETARKVDEALLQLARVGHGSGRFNQVPLFLRCNGSGGTGRGLHVGGWKAPVSGGDTYVVEPSTGLVEAKRVADATTADALVTDPFALKVAERYDLVLLGRPDIQVGDLVRATFGADPANLATDTVSTSLLGPAQDAVTKMFAKAGGGDRTDYRVESVSHRLSPSEGFVTTLRVRAQPAGPVPKTEPDGSRGGTEAARLAATIEARRRRDRAERRTTEVGLVARQTVTSGDVEGRDVPAQRLVVHEGLSDAPAPNVPVTAGPAKSPVVVFDKPYLTPFAFGACGLVIPHYPGARVLSGHYLEDRQNAVVLGALWPDGTAPKSRLGDWWLSLPTGVAAAESAGEPARVTLPSGPASHDLIDADGARAIHVRGFRISLGRANMPDAGKRPDDPPADELVVEHDKANAKIRIDSQGNIEISTDKDIKLTARKIIMNVTDAVEVP